VEGQTASPLHVGNECFMLVMDQRYFVEILGLTKDTVWVSFPASNYPLEGMGAELQFHSNNGLSIFHTRVAKGPEKKGDGVILQRSESASFLKHRRSWRVACDLSVMINTLNEARLHEAQLVYLSAEGALVETRSEFDSGELLNVSFTLPNQPTRALRARVIHYDSATMLRSGKLGLRFTDVPPDSRETLTIFLYREIRERYPKELRAMYPRHRARP
jgi:Tfp pilus assembly protein PilZ